MLKPREVAEKLGVNVRTVGDWIASGKLRALRVGRVIRVEESEVERFKREHTS